MTMLRSIREIIKGNIKDVLRTLREEMLQHAESLEFEKAQIVKQKYDRLQQYQSKSVVVSPDITELDVFSISVSPTDAFVNFIGIVNGVVIKSRMLELKKRLEETPEELLGLAIVEMRQQQQSIAGELIVPFIPDAELDGVSYTVPQRGDKHKLLELSERNVRLHRAGQEKLQKITDPELHTTRLMTTMQTDLRMSVPPTYIECFDNSNIQGAYPVSSMVVFRNGKPAKKEYRHFNIKTVEGPNDFATMEEVIFRRYDRLLKEKQELPQLIVIDGGKGQLSAALNSLEKLGLKGKIATISIAKRLEEIYFPGDSLPLYIDKTSQTLKVIQQLRNEAHRFGITHHRNRRSKSAFVSEMNAIPGIGTKTIETLLKEYGSLAQIKKVSEEELTAVVGKAKARILRENLDVIPK
jgi:excinuclease ABC subunit C